MSILKLIFAFNILLVTTDATSFENSLNTVRNEIKQIENDTKMGYVEKYVRKFILNQMLERIMEAKELYETEKENEANKDRIKFKLFIFNKYLASRMGASSFNKDFHTIRY